ncbi:hypothetical protein OBK05_02435 [Empedobacter falsenii]
MKLLIKNNKELIKYLPMLDASITFDRLTQDLILATEEVVKIIGDNMYDHVVSLYENPTEDAKKLIDVVAYPIAVDAYRKYVIQNDVAHTNEGRKARLNEYEKMPFEWMIDRDNKSSEKKYYKGLDRLIEYLDKNNPNNWKSTKEYKSSFTSLFRTTSEFDEYFSIESRLLLMKLVPGVNKCITEEIIPRVTQEVWNDIVTKLTAGETVPNLVLLSKIKAACAYYAMSWGVLRMSATLFPEGILQNYVASKMQVPAKQEIGVVAKLFENDYQSILLDIEKFVAPEVVESTETIDMKSLIDIDPNSKIFSI